jgi:hypothetical protein
MNGDLLIMNNLIRKLPSLSFTKAAWQYFDSIPLADLVYDQSDPFDILLGADVYSKMLHGVIREDQSKPIVQQTQFEWILCGKVKSYYCNDLNN